MAGKNKIVLGRIANDTKRKLSFKRRKAGLLKKVEEFSTLCGVESALVMYPPGEDEPTVWPSREEASKRLERFEEKASSEAAGETSKSMTLETYLTERVEKETTRIEGVVKKNDTTEMKQLMVLLSNGEKCVRELDLEELKKWNVFAGEQISRLMKRRVQLEREEDQAQHANLATRTPDHFPPPPTGADQYNNLHP